MKQVLFVCTGNSCRSPMAEAYFNALAAQRPDCRWMAASAGLCAPDGAPASGQARAVMAEYGIDLSRFRSSALTRRAMIDSDLIVGMTASHVQQMQAACPDLADRCHLLLEWAHSNAPGSVPDPFAGDVPVYRECFNLMKPALENLFRQLNSLED